MLSARPLARVLRGGTDMHDTDPRHQGALAALHQFGVAKSAGWTDQIAPTVKSLLIGDPSEYWEQLNNGKLFSRKGMIAQTLNPVVKGSPGWTALQAALMYGLPAYGLYQAAKAPAHARGSTLGATIGGLIGGTVGAPLGLVGNMAGGALGASAGESLGRTFNEGSSNQHKPDIRPSVGRGYTAAAAKPLSAEMSGVTRGPTEFER